MKPILITSLILFGTDLIAQPIWKQLIDEQLKLVKIFLDNHELDSMKVELDIAINDAKEIGYLRGEIIGYYRLGYYFNTHSALENALKTHQIMYEKAVELDSLNYQGWATQGIGLDHTKLHDFDLAQDAFGKVLVSF